MSERDILRELGHLALGSRLKRLADRFMADAAKIHQASSHNLPTGQFPLIAALDRHGPLTVGDAAATLGISQPAATRAATEAAKAGYIESSAGEGDRRIRRLSLTSSGRQSVAEMKLTMWPRVDAVARELTKGIHGDLLSSITALEGRLAERGLLERYRDKRLSVVPFSDELAPHFARINTEWIESMFSLEDEDRRVLENPRATILANGGSIFFVQEEEGSVLGTCALEPKEGGYTELLKMGVTPEARGRGAGEFLLRVVLEHARAQGLSENLILLTNTACAPAIRLYEKVGFVHDAEILKRFGPAYARADVAMRFADG
ncbi:MAG: GNAT family N-acetyltransferase [Planctomycetota bacterium]